MISTASVRATTARASPHEVFPFTDHMERYYNRADVVISRSGASTIFELSYFRKPAVFIPYPFAAGGHQWKNASYVERLGGGRVIANSEVSGEKLYRALTSFEGERGRASPHGRAHRDDLRGGCGREDNKGDRSTCSIK